MKNKSFFHLWRELKKRLEASDWGLSLGLHKLYYSLLGIRLYREFQDHNF